MILACAKKTNRKGQSKLFSVIDTLGLARARNKARIVAEHSLRVCSERADAGLPTLLCHGQLATWGPFQGGWRDTSSRAALGFLPSKEGKQNVASVSPCVPGVASGQALEGGCCKGRGGEKPYGKGNSSSASVAGRRGVASGQRPQHRVPQAFLGKLLQILSVCP